MKKAPDLLEEDGWIFRERPGVPVECVGRAEDERIGDMTQPNQIRTTTPAHDKGRERSRPC